MKACVVFVLICIATVLTTASADGPCDEIKETETDWDSKVIQICIMQSTVIDSKNFLITSDRDETFEGFYVFGNDKLQHLPNNLGAKFPNLIILVAAYCSIKEISKDNFNGLSKLQRLNLGGNQIEKIDDDTFEYIPAVQRICLDINKIKKLNGRAFASLHKLTQLRLFGNECIIVDFYFITATNIASMSRIITEKCGFVDPEPSSTKIAKPEAQSQD